MKYSAVALLALAQGIVAIPSLLGQIKQSQSKALVPDQEISLSIKLSQIPMHRDMPHTKKENVCWLLCASEEIQCPDEWYSSHQGECWTCCHDLETSH
ncbi:uncharacterized protein FPRN_13476 [Fusarium proliferatum]|nr:uncharacterized protein FPRN_13476 [Fusarium proliferatum]